MRLALIGCSGPKLDRAAPARELYTSRLFRAAVAYAEATCDDWAVLSARHGLVRSWRVLEPYDTTFEDLTRDQRGFWAWKVHKALLASEVCLEHADVVLLAGKEYSDRMTTEWRCQGVQGLAVPRSCEEPLRGLPVGKRYAWLVAETAKAGAVAP